MNVLGKGPDRLQLPAELQKHVTVHRRLPFEGFYSVICHNLVGIRLCFLLLACPFT